MKILLFTLLFFSGIAGFGQLTRVKLEKELNKINSITDADEFIANNPGLDAEVISISGEDTLAVVQMLLSKKKGEVVFADNYGLKILESKMDTALKASYIFLDGSKLTKKRVKELQKDIITKYTNGQSFSRLASAYNMDGNPNNGDLGWFSQGMMVKEFEEAIKAHKKGEVFAVDIPSQNWFYVAKKTADVKYLQLATVIKIKFDNY